MADLAIGRTCPHDGTLTACAGSKNDLVLVGVCACCGRTVRQPNHFFAGDPADATLAAIDEPTVAEAIAPVAFDLDEVADDEQ